MAVPALSKESAEETPDMVTQKNTNAREARVWEITQSFKGKPYSKLSRNQKWKLLEAVALTLGLIEVD